MTINEKLSATMSEFVPQELWDDILRRHWNYLETDESPQKLEEHKQLQGRLHEFLCIVPHDRKFFLPETAHVLKKSVMEMDDFTAYKGCVGFESISQYANNLFTKPWRKEFHILKLYSGFYQHEILSNLVDAEKLFEAMGYKNLSTEIMVLDGPICPDQVTNVSRDAMAAHMECKIMKQIYSGLIAIDLTCTWERIFSFREKHTGNPHQAVQELAFIIQEERYRDNCNSETAYSSSQRPLHTPNNYSSCQNWIHPQNKGYMMPPHSRIYEGSSSHQQCALHRNGAYEMTSQNMPISATAGHYYNPQTAVRGGVVPQPYRSKMMGGGEMMMPHISHSRSLEHHNETPVMPLQHQHSFDQHRIHNCATQLHAYGRPARQHHLYEVPYDCLDGGGSSTVSYADLDDLNVAGNAEANCNINSMHNYNISGNRIPLPTKIANQFVTTQHHHDGQPALAPPSSNYRNMKLDAYSLNSYQIDDRPPPLLPISMAKNFHGNLRQSSFSPDYMMNAQDRQQTNSHHTQMRPDPYATAGFDRLNYAMYAQPRDILGGGRNVIEDGPHHHHHYASQPDASILYAQPQMRGSRLRTPAFEAAASSEHFRLPQQNNLKIRNGSQNMSAYDRNSSFEDYGYDELPGQSSSQHQQQRSPTQYTKNQDGRGSFESWDYVFQRLQQSDCSKDLKERDDLSVQGLNLDGVNLPNGSTEKRRESTKTSRQPSSSANMEKSLSRTLEASAKTTQSDRSGHHSKQEKSSNSVLKHDLGSSSGSNVPLNSKSASSLKTPSFGAQQHDNNNFNGNHGGDVPPAEIRNSASERKNVKRQTSANNSSTTTTAAPISKELVIGPDEWSCQSCTYINPTNVRICDICSKTRNLDVENQYTKTPTRV